MITKNLALAVAAILVAGTDAQEPDCDAEVIACAAVPECQQAILMDSVATVPELYAALLEYTEGAALLACESSGDPCGAEAIACGAVPECFAVLESGWGSCGDAPCEVVLVPGVMVFDPSAETGECDGGEFLETGECTYVAGATPEAVFAALLGSTEGAALASCRATSSGHPDAQRCSAWSGDCPEGQRVMAHADDRECGTQ